MSLSPTLQGVIIGALLSLLTQVVADWLRRRHETRIQRTAALERALEEIAELQELATVAYLGCDWTEEGAEPVVIPPPYKLTAIVQLWCPDLRDVLGDLMSALTEFRGCYADAWINFGTNDPAEFDALKDDLQVAHSKLQDRVTGFYEMAALQAHGAPRLFLSGLRSVVLGKVSRRKKR